MWEELGIAPCDDPKAIRRAYAARLKKLNPDRDPEGFARLREALEWALAHGADAQQSASDSSADVDLATAEDDAEPDIETSSTDSGTHADDESNDDPAPQKASPTRFDPPVPDQDARDRALLIALDTALRQRDAKEAITLYYRAAATGALSLVDAPDELERVLAVAVEDRKLDAATFQRLARTAGFGAPRAHVRPASAVLERVQARLAAQNWYEELLAAAAQRRGRVTRRRAKIARYLLGRIGHYGHPRVDRDALKTWLTQYRLHQTWLDDRIDAAWIDKIEGRWRRRQIFWLCFYILFIGSIVTAFAVTSVVSVIEGNTPYLELAGGLVLVAIFVWVIKIMISELIGLTFRRSG
jgi:hypothetical protein